MLVPAGKYIIGTIYLRSHVELHLERGAVLIASRDLKDYNAPDAYPQNWNSKVEEWNACHLILAIGIEDASLTGPGTIDGSAEYFYVAKNSFQGEVAWRHGYRAARDKQLLRPGQMVVFIECKDVSVFDLKLQNSTCWTLFFHGCENVMVRGLQIRNPIYHANTDGVDIDCCKNVVISDCIIETGDDAIALRGDNERLLDKGKCCENISITNCVLTTGVCGLRIGVGAGTIRNAVISNLTMPDCGEAVHIQAVYGNKRIKGVDISNLRFSNIVAPNCSMPINIEAGSAIAEAEMSNISFEHCWFRGFHCVNLSGNDQCILNHLAFSDIDFEIVDAPVVYRLSAPPENYIVIKKVDDIAFSNVRMRWNTKDSNWKSAMTRQDVHGLRIDTCAFPEPS